MKIIVLGAGAMGSIYGSRLSKNADVTLVDVNRDLVDKINRDGIILEKNGSEELFYPKASADPSKLDVADLIILFTKALYSLSALESVKNAIGEKTYLMSLQNGAGHEDILSKYQSKDRIIIGTTEDNGAVISFGKIHHGGSGRTNIGKIKDEAFQNELITLFSLSSFHLIIHEDINYLVWDKLMTNVSLSALSAIFQSDMSFISESESARKLCYSLIKEAVDVASKMNLSFESDAIFNRVMETSRNNKGGYTSIMMDIKNKRKTEVDTITGAVVKKAKELNVDAPHHEAVLSIIHALEEKNALS